MLVSNLLCLFAFLATSSNVILCEAAYSPVIIVPGDGASPIDCMVTGKGNCHRNGDWYRLWPNVEDIVFRRFACSAENMALIFDPATNSTHSPKTIQTRVPGWGTARVVEYIVDDFIAKFFHKDYDAESLIKAMESWGYEKDISIRGAPYDFRFAMASRPEYFERLKQLVQDTWTTNQNRRVTLISHSMGGLYATWFLNNQPQEWKDKYIHAFVPLSSPWGGSGTALHALTSGFNFHIPTVPPLRARKLQRTWESNYMVIPDHRFHQPGHVFIYTTEHNYTLTPEDINLLFKNTNNKLGPPIYSYVSKENKIPSKSEKIPMPPHPGVSTYCFYGVDLPTEGQYVYPRGGFPDTQPAIVKSNGDGTIVRESLSGCKMWTSNRKFYAEANEVSKTSHMEVFSDLNIQAKIKKILWIGK